MIKVIPYKIGSQSAKNLAMGLNALRIVSPDYRQKRRDILVNWGATRYSPSIHRAIGPVFNESIAVRHAADKTDALPLMRIYQVPVPEHTVTHDVALGWLNEGSKVVCRTITNGHSGRGIVVVKPGQELIHAPLYTKYFTKAEEYRVHVCNGIAFDWSQKKLRNGARDVEGHSPYIRNHANGWIFARCDVNPPNSVLNASIRAVSIMGLHFGAVDVAINEDGEVVVFEVNTAPGLEGTTLQKYIEQISRLCHGM